MGRWRGRGLEWSGGRLIGRQCVCSMGFVSWDVGSGLEGGMYYSAGFFEEFIFWLGGILAGTGIVLFEERVEEGS